MTVAVKSLTLIEIDVDRCSLTYGTAPCTASIPATGDIKCYNSRSTCQDRANFTNDPVTLRFAKATAYLPKSFEAIASIESVEYDPGIISLGENLGQRASIAITFKDHPWSDTGQGFDKYLADRNYNPFAQGTFWGKFRARQPFLQGRPLRWLDGILGQELAEMDVRHFVIESFNGPTPDGRYKLIAKDVLKLADGDRAQAPVLSTGRLAATIAADITSVSLTPTGIGDAEYPASGYLNLGGKEIVSFTRTADALTLVRAQFNTTAIAHDAQSRAQFCLYYGSDSPADILRDLLVTYAGVDAAYIDLPAWQTEVTSYFQRLFTGIIAEPTSVRKLCSEIIEQAALAVWHDPLEHQVRLQVLRKIATDAETFTRSNSIEGSLGIKEQPDKRVSRVWVYYWQINPLEGQDDPSNYRASEAVIETDAEQDYGAPKVKKIFSRWIAGGGALTALRLGDLILAQYKDPPRRFNFSVARHGADTPTLGEGAQLLAQPLQDATGNDATVPVQITRLKTTPARWMVEAEEANFAAIESDDLNTRDVTISASVNRLNLRTQHDLLYPAPVGGETINCYIEQWVTLGATSTNFHAFDTGDWPSVAGNGTRTSGSPIITGIADTSDFAVGMGATGTGIPNGTKVLSVDSATQITLDKNATSAGTSTVTVWTVIINVYLRGRVQGAGGSAGDGATWNPTRDPTNGAAGGPAMKVRAPVNLILNQGLGECWGGGGGGGGADVLNLNEHRGGGGGGGAGVPAGNGGGGYDQAEDGDAGSNEAGGIGGRSYASFSWSQWPHMTDVRGGTGGAPGQAGNAGGNHGGNPGEQSPGAGGAAGAAIDGISFVSKTGTGDIRGGQIG